RGIRVGLVLGFFFVGLGVWVGVRRRRWGQVWVTSVWVEPPVTPALGRHADSSETGCRGAALDMKLRQASKIREIGHTLVDVGFPTLDMQARSLGLSRSTT